jgi:plastocyanin
MGCIFAGSVPAADISGIVVVEKKLTRRNVTASAPAYQRGVAVPLASPEPEDALSFERSHVVVYLEGKGPAADRITATIQQEDRTFRPDLAVVPAGSKVSFPNLDVIFHNVFSLSKPKSFDLGNYPKGQTRTVTFPVAGIVYVYCHLHTNMAASIVVTPNQWFARADEQGNFKLPEVPPGKYTAVAWHKTAGFFRQTVTVTEQGAPPLRFLIPFTEDNDPKAVAKK